MQACGPPAGAGSSSARGRRFAVVGTSEITDHPPDLVAISVAVPSTRARAGCLAPVARTSARACRARHEVASRDARLEVPSASRTGSPPKRASPSEESSRGSIGIVARPIPRSARARAASSGCPGSRKREGIRTRGRPPRRARRRRSRRPPTVDPAREPTNLLRRTGLGGSSRAIPHDAALDPLDLERRGRGSLARTSPAAVVLVEKRGPSPRPPRPRRGPRPWRDHLHSRRRLGPDAHLVSQDILRFRRASGGRARKRLADEVLPLVSMAWRRC